MTTMSFIGGKWKPVVLWHLRDQARRFSDLGRRIPSVSQKVLTQQLRELERDGIVDRKVYPVVPPHVEYSLTAFGRTLSPVVYAICEWGYDHGGWRPSAVKLEAEASEDFGAEACADAPRVEQEASPLATPVAEDWRPPALGLDSPAQPTTLPRIAERRRRARR